LSSEFPEARSNCIITKRTLVHFKCNNILLVQELVPVQENKFGCFIPAQLITQFQMNDSVWWKYTFNTRCWHRC